MADSDMSEGEQVSLFFKQHGIEIVTDAKESFKNLTEEMKETAKAADQVKEATKSVDTTTQQAIDVLKSNSTVVKDLKQKIAELTTQQNALRDSFIAGLIPSASRFKEKFDDLAQSIEEKQGILDRAVGEGGSEDGTSGFKGIAGTAVKAEKAISKLASGHGLNSLPGLLESVGGALGLGGGAGLAAGGLILAFESVIPKIVTFIEKMDGAAKSAEHAAAMMKAADDQMRKLKEQPAEEEETSAKVVKEALSGKKGMQIATGIEQSLLAEGYSLNEYQMKLLANPNVSQYEKDIILEGQRSAIITRRGRIMKELEAGHQAAISDVEGMAIRHEGFFPVGTEQRLRRALPENIEAAKKQSQKAQMDSDWADATYAKQEAARKDSEAIDIEFDKAFKDKKKHAAAEYDAAMKFAADYKAKLDAEAEHDAKKAANDAKTNANKAARDKEKFDREHTPEALNRAQAKADAEAVMAEEQRQNEFRANMGAVPFEAGELEKIKSKAMAAMPMARARGANLAQLVDWAMAQYANEIEQGLTAGMGRHDRSRQNTNPRGGY